MAFRTNSMQGYWKSMANALRTNLNTFTTSTSPKLKAYTCNASLADRPSSGIKSKAVKGDYFPLMVSVGMICLSASFGLYTVWHQVGEAPNVFVKKSRRGTLPEVMEIEHGAAGGRRKGAGLVELMVVALAAAATDQICLRERGDGNGFGEREGVDISGVGFTNMRLGYMI
ncbi:hypothetical protein ACS0TY_010573 [Phlomoides rotata]